jgi:hypothetical protein
MWLQRKVPCLPATDVLPTPADIPLASRIAAIAHITEQSLRQMGDPSAMGDREAALREALILKSSGLPRAAHREVAAPGR